MSFPATQIVTTTANKTMANSTISAVVSQATVSQSVVPVNVLTLQDANNEGSTRYTDLSFAKTICEKGEALDITQRYLFELPGAIYMSIARILLIPSELHFTYDIQVLFVSIKSSTISSKCEFFEVCDVITKESNYKFCPGFDTKMYYDEYYGIIRYHIRGVHLWDKSFNQINSISCLLWHQLAKNIGKEEKPEFAVLCKQCKCLLNLLAHQK